MTTPFITVPDIDEITLKTLLKRNEKKIKLEIKKIKFLKRKINYLESLHSSQLIKKNISNK